MVDLSDKKQRLVLGVILCAVIAIAWTFVYRTLSSGAAISNSSADTLKELPKPPADLGTGSNNPSGPTRINMRPSK